MEISCNDREISIKETLIPEEILKDIIQRELPELSHTSHCLHRQVGSVLYSISKNKVVSRGSNRLPTKYSPCLDSYSCTKYETGRCPILHSEMRCLYSYLMENGGSEVNDLILVCDYSPCYECSKVLAFCKIPIVYYVRVHHKTDFKFLQQAGVHCLQIKEGLELVENKE